MLTLTFAFYLYLAGITVVLTAWELIGWRAWVSYVILWPVTLPFNFLRAAIFRKGEM